jgi:hypothetical protein
MTGGRFVQPPKEDPYDAIINLVIDYKTVYGRVPDLIVCEEIPEQCQKTNTIKIDEKDILLCLAGKL